LTTKPRPSQNPTQTQPTNLGPVSSRRGRQHDPDATLTVSVDAAPVRFPARPPRAVKMDSETCVCVCVRACACVCVRAPAPRVLNSHVERTSEGFSAATSSAAGMAAAFEAVERRRVVAAAAVRAMTPPPSLIIWLSFSRRGREAASKCPNSDLEAVRCLL